MYINPKPLTPPTLPILGSSFERPSGKKTFPNKKCTPQTNRSCCVNKTFIGGETGFKNGSQR